MFQGLKVYIAGPITGTDDYKERFAAAEKYLRDQGATPMHSAFLPQGYSHAEYLYICRAMIDVCEAVYFLDGYSESEGSRREFCYAASKNKQFLYEGLDPAWKFDNAIPSDTKGICMLLSYEKPDIPRGVSGIIAKAKMNLSAALRRLKLRNKLIASSESFIRLIERNFGGKLE